MQIESLNQERLSKKLILLNEIKNNYNSKMSNILWNVGNYIGLGWLIKHPQLLNISLIPPTSLEVDGLRVDAYQAFGLALIERDRTARAEEIIAGAKRSLICDSSEIFCDTICRLNYAYTHEVNPYEEKQPFSVLFTQAEKLLKKFLSDSEANFIEKYVAPLRHNIRHNNGIFIPGKIINYTDRIHDVDFKFNSDGMSNLQLSLEQCNNIHNVLLRIGNKFSEVLIRKIHMSEY